LSYAFQSDALGDILHNEISGACPRHPFRTRRISIPLIAELAAADFLTAAPCKNLLPIVAI